MRLRHTTQFVILVWVLFCGWVLASLRTLDEIPSTLVERRPTYEVHRVPAHVVASMPVASKGEARSEAEHALRDYLADIAPRAALVSEAHGGYPNALWAFLPTSFTGSTAPRPQDPHIRLIDVPARTMAVVSLWGWIDQAKVDAAEATLRATLTYDKRITFGSASLVGYSPSWAPSFLRHSVLMIPIHPR
jgi:hypothetical protein